MTLQHLRSSTADKRPTPGAMSDGQLAMNTNLVSPGLFLKDSNGDLVKVGPVHVGTTAPNATPGAGGQAGNSKGEQWLDTSSSRYVFKIWDGTAWRTEDGEFVNVSGDTMTGALGIIAGTAAAPGVFFSGDTNTGIYSPAADTIAFAEGGTEAARIDSSGRLLVGTSSSPNAGTGQYALSVVQGYAGSATGEGIVSIARGKVATAMVNADTIGQILFTDNAGNTFSKITSFVDGTVSSTSDLPGALAFSTTADAASSPTERMRIDNQGRINSTCVKDNVAAHVVTHNGTNGSQYGLAVTTANDQNGTATYFFTGLGAATERFTVRTNGGIANYSASNVNLSDINTKKDISPVADTWDCIKEWEIVNYRYKDQSDDADLNLGVIAQQVAESCPEVITVFSEAKEAKPAVLDDDGNEVEPAQEAQSEKLGVKEQQMYWMAIKALQEAQIRIEQLESRLTAAGIE